MRQLQGRVKLLERILWLHSIDIDEATARLQAQRTNDTNDTQPGDKRDSLNSREDTQGYAELCKDMEGALSLDQSVNFDDDGQPHYFGKTSGRLALWNPESGKPQGIYDITLYVANMFSPPPAQMKKRKQRLWGAMTFGSLPKTHFRIPTHQRFRIHTMMSQKNSEAISFNSTSFGNNPGCRLLMNDYSGKAWSKEAHTLAPCS